MDVREVPREPFRRHPWEVARCRFFRELLAEQGLLSGRALDVGAGDAWVAEELVRASGGRLAVTCWDAAYGDAASREASAVVEKTATRPSGRFDLVLLLDVLEHVEDDVGFLASLVRESLAPGGRALISVPAWPALYGRHDVGLHHHRRYTPRSLDALLERGGLVKERGGGVFGSLIGPRAAMNVVDKLRGRNGAGEPPPLVWNHGELSAKAIEAALAVDTWVAGAVARVGGWVPGLTEWRLARP